MKLAHVASWLSMAALGSVAACGGDDEKRPANLDTGGAGGSIVGAGGSGGTSAAGTAGAGGSAAAGTAGSAGSVPCAAVSADVVQLTTSDDVELEADLYTTGMSNQPGAVLLHMIPPGNTRANYPSDFIVSLVNRGINVLNVDRRGAGASQGNPVEAYTGPNGKLDAVAAYHFLVDHECAIDRAKVAYVGASNGSTTALDLAVHASSDAAVETPAALVFLTGGGYTENQNSIDGNRAILEPIPIDFVFSTAERDWSATFEAGAPATWRFDEYDPGAHGTSMFSAAPASIDAVADFIANAMN